MRWYAVLGGLVAGVTAVVGVQGCTGRPAAPPVPAVSSPSAAATRAVPPATTPPSPAPAPPPELLRAGARGPEVLALQRRLVDLGYWLGTPDGEYGAATQHAVTAFQKAGGLARDGVDGPLTQVALQRATRPRPRSGSGRVVEVDLARQLLLLAVDGRTEWVLDASTGAVAGTTPTGHFTVYRQVDGDDPGPLGVLYRPKYFTGGVAVHGYPSVPAHPASHGCVRVTDGAMDWLWSTGALRIGQPVWVY
jgi:hypothetical protein